MIILVSF